MTSAEFLALSDERDQWLALLDGAEKDAYRRGLRAGWRLGYARAHADRDADWARIARPASRGMPHAELERRRYRIPCPACRTGRLRGGCPDCVPGDREAFSRPLPGEYQGGPVPAW